MKPILRDMQADQRFRKAANAAGLNPDSRWVGGYVDYQWTHSRHVFEALPISISGAKVLEFGCNFGASSIVLATIGAEVTGVDVNPSFIEVAKCNAARYGLEEKITFLHLDDTSAMPFADESFDLISCISVLEYVPSEVRARVQLEIDRVLKLGGMIFVGGTSSRIWPRENHSGKWLIHYLPIWMTKSLRVERGVTPWQVRFGFGKNYVNVDRSDQGAAFLKARDAMDIGAS